MIMDCILYVVVFPLFGKNSGSVATTLYVTTHLQLVSFRKRLICKVDEYDGLLVCRYSIFFSNGGSTLCAMHIAHPPICLFYEKGRRRRCTYRILVRLIRRGSLLLYRTYTAEECSWSG